MLDAAAAIHHSKLKYAVIYALMGLFVGLVLGLGIVIVRALVSDRLRRRDDIAEALGAPVDLSVGKIYAPRWRPGWPGRRTASAMTCERLVAHLGNVVPGSSSGPAALAVVPVDNEKRRGAFAGRAGSVRCARGRRVVVADLCRGAPAADLLGVKKPGVQKITADGAELVVAIPGRDDVIARRTGSRHRAAGCPYAAGRCAGRRLRISGPPAHAGAPRPLHRGGAPRDVGGGCGRDGDRRAVVLGADQYRGRDDPSAPGRSWSLPS